MNLAKVSTNGQITVPVEIRHLLKVESGDKIVFMLNDMGEVIVRKLSKATYPTDGQVVPFTSAMLY